MKNCRKCKGCKKGFETWVYGKLRRKPKYCKSCFDIMIRKRNQSIRKDND